MAADDFAGARRWFARACRLAPSDVTPKFSRAVACLAANRPDEAAPLFRVAAEQTDARAAWLGLAACHARLGQAKDAAAALGAALSRHVASALADGALADAIAAAAGFSGWCGLDGSGRLIGRAARPRLRLHLDAIAVPGAGFGHVPPAGSKRLAVFSGGRALLGSPIDVAAIRRMDGLVEVEGDGLSGWAWHPGDPGRAPMLTLMDAAGVTRTLRATDAAVAAPSPLTEPRGFHATYYDLAGLREPIAVFSPDGNPLAGSPVSPAALADTIPVSAPDSPAVAPRCPDRSAAIVVPVYRGVWETADCLADLLASVPVGSAVIVVDDASPEPALVDAIDALAASGRVRLLRHAANRGFPAAANAGLAAAMALDPPHDVVLLNSDTRMAPGWLERLRGAVQGSPDIGTATPLSNDASIASYPDPAGGNPPQAGRDLETLSRLVAAANPDTVVDVPTGVGFCLYLRHECVRQTGPLREDAFGQGYGEENDFCLRANRLGWRHVVVPGAYVAHVGGRSFGPMRTALLARNLRVLERLHPGYRALVARWIDDDPLAVARRRIDVRRWDGHARGRLRESRGCMLLVTHDHGGGVERCVQTRLRELRESGHWPILLRPVLDRRETPAAASGGRGLRTVPGLVRLDEPGFPNLVFSWPDDRAALERLLRGCRPEAMEVHHLLGLEHGVLDLAVALGIPTNLRLHDYAAFCPRITLTVPSGRYCGEPDVAGCVACIAAHGDALDEAIGPAALRARSAAEFSGARAVIVPSVDMAARIRRHFPGLAPLVAPHEADPAGRIAAHRRGAEVRVVVVGAIGRAKGHDVLLACARDAAARALPLRFIVVGRTIDDEELLETGRADITGPYPEGEAAALIAEQDAAVGFIPSLWPETWCFALGEVLRAGLPALAFDIGAQAERIARTGRGWLLPLGAPPAAINRILLAPPALSATVLAARANVMQTGTNRLPIQPSPTSESSP